MESWLESRHQAQQTWAALHRSRGGSSRNTRSSTSAGQRRPSTSTRTALSPSAPAAPADSAASAAAGKNDRRGTLSSRSACILQHARPLPTGNAAASMNYRCKNRVKKPFYSKHLWVTVLEANISDELALPVLVST